jgi:hypothetical protein
MDHRRARRSDFNDTISNARSAHNLSSSINNLAVAPNPASEHKGTQKHRISCFSSIEIFGE